MTPAEAVRDALAPLALAGYAPTAVAWARPRVNAAHDTERMVAALLKAYGALAKRQLMESTMLCLEPTSLLPSLAKDEARRWTDAIGSEVTSPTAEPPGAWGTALRNLRAHGYIDHGADDVLTPTPKMATYDTSGWPDGRARFVREVVERIGVAQVLSVVPETIRGRWNVAA